MPTPRIASFVSAVAMLACAASPSIGAPDATPPKLQIINGSSETIDIFWLKPGSERVPNGSVAPGNETIISTTLGHRFEIVGRDNKKSATVTSVVPVQALRFDPQGRDGVPAFYTQSVSAHGFPIVASAKVNPYALKEAAFLVDMMLSNRPDVRAAMVSSGARMCILAHNEFTTDLPEFARLAGEKESEFEEVPAKDFWDARARGLGGSETDPYCSVAEENVLAFPGDPYFQECILIHEFAHNIHLRGLLNVDPTFDGRLKATYDAAMKAGLWKGKYAATNHCEYFAEGVQSWFDNNRVNDHDHNHVNTRALLLEYDPGLAAMCREVFGETVIKYTKPTTRLTGHMTGYDPSSAPNFVWPERLKLAKEKIHAKAVARDRAANGGSTIETRTVVGWTVHIRPEFLAEDPKGMARALELLQKQLEEIVRVVPAPAVAQLRKVPLWFSPEYPKTQPRAEYHPGAGWLRDNGRDPVMAKGVEFTNVRNFEAETRRMPNFTLHELAHSYHDQVLPGGFGNEPIKAAYEKAKAGGKYDSVERQDSEGRKRMDRAYAMTNPQEYFAECTEAFFSRNDFFPYTRDELQKHDPEVFELLVKLWGCADNTSGGK
ncbi:MAG: zinc-dependent peptidase [Verrucomicrobiaceae bacterium]